VIYKKFYRIIRSLSSEIRPRIMVITQGSEAAASLKSWILLRDGLYPRFNAGTFIHRGIKESVVHKQYAENTCLPRGIGVE